METVTPKIPSRRTLIHFAAAMGRRYQLDGAEVCRLLRLVARYQSGKDQEESEIVRLTTSIEGVFKNPNRPEIFFTDRGVFVGDTLVP
jgi:hypothetical protein